MVGRWTPGWKERLGIYLADIEIYNVIRGFPKTHYSICLYQTNQGFVFDLYKKSLVQKMWQGKT